MSAFPFTAAGLDVGYGNVKLSARAAGEPILRELTMPIGAVPLEQAPKKIVGGYDIRDGVIVSIDGQAWAAGMEPSHLQGFSRPTHENYPATNEYKALMIGALVKAGLTEVDMLYTGIPVAQYYGHNGVALRTQICNTMTGTHWINSTTSIKVKATTVVPQAAGAYMDILARSPDLKPSKGSPTLVIDVGYFSVDWVRVIDNAVLDRSSGSSLNATSVLLEKAAALIGMKYERPISAARLESAFRSGEETLNWGQVSLHVGEWMETAAEEIAPKVFNDVVRMQRHEEDFPNLVVLTGGGGSLYKRAAEQFFPHSKVALSREPVMANARGFQHLAHHKISAQQKAQASAATSQAAA
ncbi:ParM/StbA family protein [Xanthomonas perforans]|uniref:ParM/StbA family protein n=3 Tax=Xanthomonas TaxID=338 RepID=A0A6L9XDJ4_XANPE|nr:MULTISPECIES: ParM/StbA family protein [Xanthomonas]APP82573.1 hypothetical protein BJD10_23080 [Xanthomonas hortorum pv. gardneri]APR13212.1 hypothetical protein BI314_23500 [Xanthomonas citri pv. citri]APR17947.1 hypothetical protein BI315_23990 [Xanthomonas citri pv. citri]APR22546.1 hypothetical protein BI316_23475 [Xanthomonas citri pv. citri]APR27181.1 hypothetical protein BJD09_23325 [Xanthomonas citri pv. citri]